MKGKEKSQTKRKNVNVVVRTRPMSEDERTARSKNIINTDGVAKTVVLKTGEKQPKTFGPFDKVYGPDAMQAEVYNEIVAPLVKEVLNGFNCTVFAYGQTGSGKTYTMEGRHDESGDYTWETDPTSGIIPRALHHIFSSLQEQDLDYYAVRVSYVEMYNEQIYDLLSTSETSNQDSLRIYEDKNKGVSIVGMEEVAVRNRNEVYALLRKGADKRRTASTLMNINSSRSHSVFTVTVMMREPSNAEGDDLIRQGKINLVDLAGSENIGRSGATEKRAREAGNINVSLLALGRVITALTANAQHIPYRESKLTRILQDSLGGKTITTIIATLSPASSNCEESINTLDYAQRAKNIKNNPEANQKITRKALLREYNDEIERLRRDLVAAREKTGIYIDKENYDEMVETSEERQTKIDELEAELEARAYEMKILLQDQVMMDEHYASVYEKLKRSLEKLEARKREVESLGQDLSTTKFALAAARGALSHSTNEFTKLRSQALNLVEDCTIFHTDLDVMHDRMDNLKETFEENDRRLGHFVADRITAVRRGKDAINHYVSAADKRAADTQHQLEEMGSAMEQFMRTMREKIDSVHSAAEDQSVLTRQLGESLAQNLSDSQVATERFTHQEFQRIYPSGMTPTRRDANFIRELADLPPPAELIHQAESCHTPRRSSFYRTRESMLDADFRRLILSPASLKTTITNSRRPPNSGSMAEEDEEEEQPETPVENKAAKPVIATPGTASKAAGSRPQPKTPLSQVQ